MTLKIIGAGMAGLLAANMLRHRDPIVYESQNALPNNHSAVLRFRSNVIGDILGIPFKKVRMIKYPVPWQNPVADALAYSYKCTGVRLTDRSIVEGMQVAERYIAPPDLIARMAERVKVELGVSFDFSSVDEKVLSTIPMPVLAGELKYPGEVDCEYSDGMNIKATIKNCDAYVSLLIPDPKYKFSRISITGDEMIVEVPRVPTFADTSGGFIASDLVEQGLRVAAKFSIEQLGIVNAFDVYDFQFYDQKYSKILPMNEDDRRNFIHWASSITGKAWQLGRFATWRPHLLLDDLVNDIRTIDRWMSSPTAGYEMDMLRGREK